MNITPLNCQVKIYVPGTIDGNIIDPVKQSQMTDLVLTKMSGLFGGATAIEGIGAWVSPTNGLVKEPVKIVTSFTSEVKMKQSRRAVLEIALDVCKEMTQECVSVEFAGNLYFVDTKTANELEAA